MSASYGKLDPEHEEAIYLLKKDGKAGRVIREMLAAGYNGMRPVSISGGRANQVAKRMIEERDELYSSDLQTRPAPQGLAMLTRRLMILAERETQRLERAERAGRLDANKLGRLATALTKMHTLLERNEAAGRGAEPPVKKGDSPDDAPPPSSFADTLTAPQEDADGTAETEAPAPVAADRVVRAPFAGAPAG